jgi:hypothetical protein
MGKRWVRGGVKWHGLRARSGGGTVRWWTAPDTVDVVYAWRVSAHTNGLMLAEQSARGPC